MRPQHTGTGRVLAPRYDLAMLIRRRTLLIALALGVGGCAPSPVVSGEPAAPATTAPPVQDATAAAAQSAIAALRTGLEGLAGLAGFAAPDWAKAAIAQCDAHLELLSLPDPLGGADQTPFPTAPAGLRPPTDLAQGEAELTARIDAVVEALEATAAASGEGDLRLLNASAATAAVGLRNRALLPVAPEVNPTRLQPTTLEASLPIALGHVWALIYGLGVGVGRLGSKDPLRAAGMARLASAKELRNRLRAGLTEVPSQPAAFDLPNELSTPAEIQAAWAELETNLLHGLARLVAASPEPRWRAELLGQVTPVQAMGGSLSYWPGWVG